MDQFCKGDGYKNLQCYQNMKLSTWKEQWNWIFLPKDGGSITLIQAHTTSTRLRDAK